MNYVTTVVTGWQGSVLQGEGPECPGSAQQIQLSECRGQLQIVKYKQLYNLPNSLMTGNLSGTHATSV